MINRQWRIAARPLGRPVVEGDFSWSEAPVAEPAAGEVLVRVMHLGFDPAQKGWMENVADYVAPTGIGDVMRAFGVGEVVASGSERFVPGDKVTGLLGWQDYATMPADALGPVPDDEFLTANLGILGTTGNTAFFGLNKIGKPFPGDTLVVTGAAGATGSTVGQIGKIAGCRVIGIAGGERKCAWLTEKLGFDAAIDYKTSNVRHALRTLAPEGVDIVWDNVGGPILDALLPRLAMHARVVVCGAISIYSEAALPPGPSNYMNLVFRRARMEGLIVLDHEAEYPWARKRLIQWIREGRLTYAEDVVEGLENAPRALLRLFSGENFGKQILTITR
jgi:NADPH-dependent curcumin reductase CurA